jgi:hypothetical protein
MPTIYINDIIIIEGKRKLPRVIAFEIFTIVFAVLAETWD